MSTESIQAIDVHAHYGKYERGKGDLVNDFMSDEAELVVRRARQANIRWTIVSPLEGLRLGRRPDAPGKGDPAEQARQPLHRYVERPFDHAAAHRVGRGRNRGGPYSV
ncbi:MAG TPA: hypothetical protein VH682_05180, partial [Gemmataceae bacterium]